MIKRGISDNLSTALIFRINIHITTKGIVSINASEAIDLANANLLYINFLIKLLTNSKLLLLTLKKKPQNN